LTTNGLLDLQVGSHRPRPPSLFEREITVSPLGLETPLSDWQDRAFEHLTEKCAYLINVRGYEAWVSIASELYEGKTQNDITTSKRRTDKQDESKVGNARGEGRIRETYHSSRSFVWE